MLTSYIKLYHWYIPSLFMAGFDTDFRKKSFVIRLLWYDKMAIHE